MFDLTSNWVVLVYQHKIREEKHAEQRYYGETNLKTVKNVEKHNLMVDSVELVHVTPFCLGPMATGRNKLEQGSRFDENKTG